MEDRRGETQFSCISNMSLAFAKNMAKIAEYLGVQRIIETNGCPTLNHIGGWTKIAKLGRPKGPGKSKLDKYRPEIEALLPNGSTQRFIAKRYGTTEANLYNWLKKHNIRRDTGNVDVKKSSLTGCKFPERYFKTLYRFLKILLGYQSENIFVTKLCSNQGLDEFWTQVSCKLLL